MIKERGMTRKEISTLAIVVVFGLLLQVGLIALDCTQSPHDTAISYVEARFALNPSMAQYLCGNSCGSCNAPVASCPVSNKICPKSDVNDHIYTTTANAAERGFEKSFAKYSLSHIETHTDYLDDTTAMVHLTATRRITTNPLYLYVANLFDLGKTYEVDEKILVKHANGKWRVCNSSGPLL
jgi:ferredoxin